jgi:two-component system response regulator AtoC
MSPRAGVSTGWLHEVEPSQPARMHPLRPPDLANVELIGDSPALAELRARACDLARAQRTTVLVSGESGTGKGVVARLIHAMSARRNEPFVHLDCTSLPATLAESELFGYERGAFTGADRARVGKLEAARGGTLFLDEIGDLDASLQAKLLRVLEERSFERVGGVTPVPFEARVIAATHRDLLQAVADGRFRFDLYHRLSVVPLRVAPLRERGDDVVRLSAHFIEHFAAFLERPLAPLSPEAQEQLRIYDFPGNVRELRNLIERAAVLSPSPDISETLIRELKECGRLREPRRDTTSDVDQRGVVGFRLGVDRLEDFQDRLLTEALDLAEGNLSRAAALIGISRFAAQRRRRKRSA